MHIPLVITFVAAAGHLVGAISQDTSDVITGQTNNTTTTWKSNEEERVATHQVGEIAEKINWVGSNGVKKSSYRIAVNPIRKDVIKKFVKIENAKKLFAPSNSPSEVELLIASSNYEVDEVVEMVFAKLGSTDEKKAKEVWQALTTHWYEQGVYSVDVYDHLGLSKVRLDGDFFSSPRFAGLEEYVSLLNHKYPEYQVSVMSVLESKLNTDQLVKMLQQADKSLKIQSLANELYHVLMLKVTNAAIEKDMNSLWALVESIQVELVFSSMESTVAERALQDLTQSWLDINLTPTDAYGRLGLAKVRLDGDFFSSPRFAGLEDYVSLLNHKYPEYHLTVMSVLESEINTDQLVKMLQQADKSLKIQSLASELYHVLMLKVTNAAIQKDMNSLWALVETIHVESVFSTMESTVAERALQDLTQSWLDKKLPPAEVYDLLGLAKVQLDVDFFSSPRFTGLEEYVSLFNHKYPEYQVSVMSVLASKLKKEDRVEMVQATETTKIIRMLEFYLIMQMKVTEADLLVFINKDMTRLGNLLVAV